MPSGYYERKPESAKTGPKKGTKYNMPTPWEKSFKLAIQQAKDAGEQIQEKKIKQRYYATQRNMEVLSKPKSRTRRNKSNSKKLLHQYTRMLERLIDEVDGYLSTDHNIVKETGLNVQEGEMVRQRKMLANIKEIITVIKALKEFKNDLITDENIADNSEDKKEITDLIKAATNTLKDAGINASIN